MNSQQILLQHNNKKRKKTLHNHTSGHDRSSKIELTHNNAMDYVHQRSDFTKQDTTTAAAAAVVACSATISAALQLLPSELWIHVLEYVDTSCPINSTTIIAVSETCHCMNVICHLYLQRRWKLSTSLTDDTSTTSIPKDGIVQRLTYQDADMAFRLYQQYIEVDGPTRTDDDVDVDDTAIGSNQKYRNYFEYSNRQLQRFITRTLQPHQPNRVILLQGLLRRQLALSDRYGQQLLQHAILIRQQQQRQLSTVLLYTHTGMGIIISMVVVVGLFWMKQQQQHISHTTTLLYDTQNQFVVPQPDTEVTHAVLRWIVALAFAGTVAFGVRCKQIQQNQRHQQQQYRQKETDIGELGTKSVSIRKSYSQPELSHVWATSTHPQVESCMNEAVRTSFPRKMKRSRTFSSSLVSFDKPQQQHHQLLHTAILSDQTESVTVSPLSWFDNEYHPTCNDMEDDPMEKDFQLFTFSDDDDDDNHDEDTVLPPEFKVTSSTPIVVKAEKLNPIGGISTMATNDVEIEHTRKQPRGWVGLYHRAVMHAKKRIVQMIIEERRTGYTNHSIEEQNEVSLSLIHACSNDRTLPIVQLLSKSIPTQDVYIGVDGTESCALHTAAFHGASQIIDFLCRDIDTAYYPHLSSSILPLPRTGIHTVDRDAFTYHDGGLCDVNVSDINGWTALHYAAGSNSVDACRVLIQYGALLHIPAVNGYTPLQWAIRLQHHDVANELRSVMTLHQQERRRRYWYQLCQKTEHSLFTIIILSLLIIPNFGLIYSKSE
jgi:Ankyrin repeats (3 copies)